MQHIINPGSINIQVWGASVNKMITVKANIFCKIEITDGNLSITGVVGPKRNGDAQGSAGQIIMSFKEYDYRGTYTLDDIQLTPLWSRIRLARFFKIWQRWHLNNLRPDCEHQRLLGWREELIDPASPPTQENMKSWKYPPVGHLTEPCPTCGYKYGSKWLKEELPRSVIDFLASLPETYITPAWI